MQFKDETTANISNVRLVRANDPRAKISRLVLSLLQWYLRSTLRIVALEICSFPLRIVAAIRTPYLRLGSTLFSANRDRSMGNFVEERKYQHACSASIRELQDNHRWVGPLDLEIAAQMHRQGALWAIDNSYPPFSPGIRTRSIQRADPSQTS